jgi:hypothetical protein
VTYLIEYLGEFEFIFEIILDNESGDQMGSFDEKKRLRKSHAWAPFRDSAAKKCAYTTQALNPEVVFTVPKFNHKTHSKTIVL